MLDFIVKQTLRFTVHKIFPKVDLSAVDRAYDIAMDIKRNAKTPEEMIIMAKQRGLTDDVINKVHDLGKKSPDLARFIKPEVAEKLFNKFFGEMK